MCLLAAALALSLAPGTAVAQQDTTPPKVVDSELEPVRSELECDRDQTAVHVYFDKEYDTSGWRDYVTVTVDGEEESYGVGSGRARRISLILTGCLSDDAVVVVSYTQIPGNPGIVSRDQNVEVENFRLKVGFELPFELIPTEAQVYAKLKEYFSGTTTFSSVESVVRAGEGHSYYEELSDVVEAGELHDRLPASERTKWGTGSSDWHQVGSPSRPPGPEDTCGGNTVPGGVWTPTGPPPGPGQPLGQGGLQGDDRSKFYWACTGDGQWVPVRTPQPGIDFTSEDQLVWTRVGSTGCMWRAFDSKRISYDENGVESTGTWLSRVGSRNSATGVCEPP